MHCVFRRLRYHRHTHLIPSLSSFWLSSSLPRRHARSTAFQCGCRNRSKANFAFFRASVSPRICQSAHLSVFAPVSLASLILKPDNLSSDQQVSSRRPFSPKRTVGQPISTHWRLFQFAYWMKLRWLYGWNVSIAHRQSTDFHLHCC